MNRVVLAVLLAACGKSESPPKTQSPVPPPIEAAAAGSAAKAAECEQLPFAETTSVPEASGAAWMTIDGALGLVVVSDSGHDGAFAIVDPDDGTTKLTGKLPLGKGASDDIEGLANRGTRMYGLTSAGSMRVWEWGAAGFNLVDGPYPIGESGVDVCKDPTKTNCERDYEGLAMLHEAPTDANACVGFACSRRDGALYCLVEKDGKLRVDGSRKIAIDRKMAIADCAFSESNELFTGNNVLGFNTVRRIDNWKQPDKAALVELGQFGTGFPEVIAARGDVIYRMSDLGGSAPSGMAKYRCPVKP